ncbi:MAG TPA: thioredoxin [Chloroflexi bacterium]|jgi:thioredoxin 1|nr:thioredoxin [Chloroflexota bacterium]
MAPLPEIDDASFEAQVLQAERPTLVDFWAEWCGPCRMMSPILEALADEHGDKFCIVKLDVQANPDVAVRYAVTSIPTMLLFVGGEVKERLVGYMPAPKIIEQIAPHTG